MERASPPLTIAHVDAETGFSGGEVQVFLLVEGLRRRGHACTLVCPPGSRVEQEAGARQIPVRTVRMRSDLDLAAVPALKRELEALRPDLVHLHTGRATWLGGLVARFLDLPAITTRRMDRPVKRNWRTRAIYGSLVRRAVAISPAVRERLIEGGVPAEKIEVIRSAVDPRELVPRVDRATTRRAFEVGEGTLVLLALASLVHRKGLDVLLDALATLRERDLVLWIAGEGPERAALEVFVKRLELVSRVRFLGRREDPADLLAACDVLVLPARAEGLGVAALQAMAAGRPVVASRVGGLAEAVVDGRTGLLVPPEDPASLAAAVARLVDDPDLRRRLGAAGPARVAEGFLADAMVEAYEKLYRCVLEETRRA